MTCPRCQHENPAGMRFCGQCAAPLASVCPSCGAANPTENKFCGQCAAPLDRSTQPRFSSPDANTRRHLAEKILTSKGALEGERNQVTVLFADVAGFSTLADIPLGTGCPTGGSAADLNLIPPRSSSMLDFTRCSHSHPILPHSRNAWDWADRPRQARDSLRPPHRRGPDGRSPRRRLPTKPYRRREARRGL